MHAVPPPTLAALMAQLEALWQNYDEIFDTLTPAQWAQAHGRTWVYADVPYHLAYFDRGLIAAALAGEPQAAPPAAMRTLREFNNWNAHQLAQRPTTQTVAELLAQMRAARGAIRQAVAALAETDAERKVWLPLTTYGGWRTVRQTLEICRMHSWNHFTQLRIRLQRQTPIEPPAVRHGALNSFIRSFPVLLHPATPAQGTFTLALHLTGPGGGWWAVQTTARAVQAAAATCTATESPEPIPADVTLTLSPETFIALLATIQSPLLAVLRGHIKIRGWRQLWRLPQFFARPDLDRPLPYADG